MKKKDQESLRKIVIIGLVLVVGYLGYQSMTSGSSPFSEASEPGDHYPINAEAIERDIEKDSILEFVTQKLLDIWYGEGVVDILYIDSTEEPTAEDLMMIYFSKTTIGATTCSNNETRESCIYSVETEEGKNFWRCEWHTKPIALCKKGVVLN